MTIIPFPRKRVTGASARPPLYLDHSELRALLDLPRLRQHASDQIDDLIDLVDWIDGDPDLEPGAEDEGAQCDDEGVTA